MMAPLVVVYQPVDKMHVVLIFCRKNVNLKCVPTGALRKNQERFFSLKFSALKNFASPTFGIHKSDQFSLVDQVQKMSEPRSTFNNSIESNFIHFYAFLFFSFLFLFPHFPFSFKKKKRQNIIFFFLWRPSMSCCWILNWLLCRSTEALLFGDSDCYHWQKVSFI